MWNVLRILVRKHVVKWPFGKLRRWKYEIKRDLKTEGLIFSVRGGWYCLYSCGFEVTVSFVAVLFYTSRVLRRLCLET